MIFAIEIVKHLTDLLVKRHGGCAQYTVIEGSSKVDIYERAIDPREGILPIFTLRIIDRKGDAQRF